MKRKPLQVSVCLPSGAEPWAEALQAALPEARRIDGLQRLSAGATLETWSFDAIGEERT